MFEADMYKRLQCESQGQGLIQLGVILLLFGLPVVLVLLGRMHPTLEMINHADACINGLFLITLGLIWSHLKLPSRWRLLVYRLMFYGTLIKWIALLSLVWWFVQGGPALTRIDTYILHDVLIGLGWFFLAAALIVGCLLAVNLSCRYRTDRVGDIAERPPPAA
jgi:hypothetical protein